MQLLSKLITITVFWTAGRYDGWFQVLDKLRVSAIAQRLIWTWSTIAVFTEVVDFGRTRWPIMFRLITDERHSSWYTVLAPYVR
jgi:hypothetical protein